MVKDLNEITQKVRAWVLWEAGHRTPKSMLRRGKIPLRSAERYIAQFKAGGGWGRQEYSQRSKFQQTPRVIRKIITKARDRKKYHSSEQMGRSAGVSKSTARRILISHGFKYSNCRKRVYLDRKRRDTRIQFAEQMLEEGPEIWDRMLISDECSVWLNKSRPTFRWTEDTMYEEGDDVHGPKIHLWGGITARGALMLEIFEDNLNAVDYLKILRRKVGEMNDLYPEGWIFQQDGSGVHRADIIKDFTDGFDEEPVAWPAYSPDLSPIENIWGWLKKKVSKDAPTSVRNLKSSIRRHWNSIDTEFLEPYFASMTERMEMVIEYDGRKIKY